MISDKKLSVMHLDDDVLELERVRLELAEFNLQSFESVETFFKMVSKETPDIFLVDIHLSDNVDGVDLIKKIRHISPNSLIFIMSNAIERARDAMANGADDFILKRGKPLELALRLKSSYDLRAREVGSHNKTKIDVIGQTMRKVAAKIPGFINSAVSTVLVSGESGTGKEVVAELFDAELGGNKVLVVNCAAIAENLFESEFFGHRRGAFTGADRDRVGYFETASGGWLFLDEVTELSMEAQAALLRAIENQEITRVGESKTRNIDVRIIAATNRNIEEQVENGKFRQDLWQRLREASVFLPPLRERKAEVNDLLDHFCTIERGGPYQITAEARRILCDHEWRSGNVRELRNCIRAMTASAIEGVLMPMGLPAWMLNGSSKSIPEAQIALALPKDKFPSWDQLSDMLLFTSLEYLAEHHGPLSLRTAAELLGMPKSTLASKLKKAEAAGVATKADIKRVFHAS